MRRFLFLQAIEGRSGLVIASVSLSVIPSNIFPEQSEGVNIAEQ